MVGPSIIPKLASVLLLLLLLVMALTSGVALAQRRHRLPELGCGLEVVADPSFVEVVRRHLAPEEERDRYAQTRPTGLFELASVTNSAFRRFASSKGPRRACGRTTGHNIFRS